MFAYICFTEQQWTVKYMHLFMHLYIRIVEFLEKQAFVLYIIMIFILPFLWVSFSLSPLSLCFVMQLRAIDAEEARSSPQYYPDMALLLWHADLWFTQTCGTGLSLSFIPFSFFVYKCADFY